MKISKLAGTIAPSMTLALTAKAKAMKAEGIDVVSFGSGEPDFDTPDFIKQAAIEDLQQGQTKYTPVPGKPDLLEAICTALQRDYGLEYKPPQTVVSTGGKGSLFNLMMVMLDPGDEVIIPSPYWLTYPEQVKAFGAKPVIVKCGPAQNFKITPEQLEAAITPKTTAFILNSPSNPTGTVYSKEDLLALGEVLKQKKCEHVSIVSDDLYAKLTYEDAKFYSLPVLMPELKDRTIIVNGLSKAYSMTGWRLGWMAGPDHIIKAVRAVQGQSTSNVVTFTQRAAKVALLSDHTFLTPWLERFNERRQLICDLLNHIQGVTIDPAPKGAFYAFPDVSATYGKTYAGKEITDSMSFADVLLEKANVSVVPGVAFGEDRCVRLSYATGEEQIKTGLARMKDFLEQ